MANGKAPKREAKKITTPTSNQKLRGVEEPDYDKTVGTMSHYLSKNPKIKFHDKKTDSRGEYKMLTDMDHYKKTGTIETIRGGSEHGGGSPMTLSGEDAASFMQQAYPQIDAQREKDYAAMTRKMGRGLVSMSKMLKSDKPSSVIAKKDQTKPK